MKESNIFNVSAKIAGTILNCNGAKDKKVVKKWIKEDARNQELFDKLTSNNFQESYLSQISKYNSSEAWSKIEYRLLSTNKRVFDYSSFYKYAALFALVFTLTLSGYYAISRFDLFNNNPQIEARSNSATLILADGEMINLSTDSTYSSDNFSITNKRLENVINYMSATADKSKYDSRLNVIKTDIGKDYTIILSDGTKAHLNSGSTLKFPVTFSRKNRVVEASGEVFFDVKRDEKKPFIVKTKDISLEVLGTSYNLNAYEENGETYTTLVSGSLRVINNNSSVVISPDQQAVCKKNSSEITVKTVDASVVASWTDGSFAFRNERLGTILKSLQRWYDFDYVFKNSECEEIRMGLNLSRETSFTKIKETLNNAELFTITQKGKIVIIENNKK